MLCWVLFSEFVMCVERAKSLSIFGWSSVVVGVSAVLWCVLVVGMKMAGGEISKWLGGLQEDLHVPLCDQATTRFSRTSE